MILSVSSIGDLKSVSYQRCFEIAAVDGDLLGRKIWQWRLCGKRLVAINRLLAGGSYQESVARGHSTTWQQPTRARDLVLSYYTLQTATGFQCAGSIQNIFYSRLLLKPPMLDDLAA